MSPVRNSGRWAVPLGLTILLLAARLAGAPAISDPVHGVVSPSLHLTTPWLYLLFGPLFTLWDGVSMLSMSRLKGFLVGLLVLYLVWRVTREWSSRRRINSPSRRAWWLRELAVLVISIGLLLAFLVIGALWHRPMLALGGNLPGDRVVDFHTHTNVSHDVRDTWMRGFDAEANRRWHARAGFDVVFITDHNTVDGLRAVGASGTRHRARGAYPAICPGIEVSAWRAHVVLLGDTVPVDRSRYNGSLTGLLSLLQTSDSTYGALSVASLPEYRRNHWDRLDQLVSAGLDGFEIVNASPKANELTRSERDTVVALARRHNRFVVGVSDSHGWGATSMVWNLVSASSNRSPDNACHSVLRQLRTGFPAVRIIERHRLRPDAWWPAWLTPLGVVWETWRSMGWALAVSWLIWIWVFAMWRWRSRGRPGP